MQTSLLHAVGVDGTISPLESAALDYLEWLFLEFRLFSASIPNSKELIMNQRSFVIDKPENIGVLKVERLVNNVANLYVGSDAGVSFIVAESNTANKSNKALLPLVPNQLVALPHS